MVIRTIGHGPEQSTLWGTFNLFVVTNDAVSVSGAVTLLQSDDCNLSREHQLGGELRLDPGGQIVNTIKYRDCFNCASR